MVSRTLLISCVLTGVQSACPEEVVFTHKFNGIPANESEGSPLDLARGFMSPQFNMIQKYQKQSGMKNERAWYLSEDGKVAIYYCGNWLGVLKAEFEGFDAMNEIPAEKCRHNIILLHPTLEQLAESGVPADVLEEYKSLPDDEKNFTCVTSRYPHDWFIPSGSEATLISLFGMTFLHGTGQDFVKAFSLVGGTCGEGPNDKGCAGTSYCDLEGSKKCECEAVDAEFPLRKNSNDTKLNATTCGAIAKLPQDEMDLLCGCDPHVNLLCGKLCKSCEFPSVWSEAECKAGGKSGGPPIVIIIIIAVVAALLVCAVIAFLLHKKNGGKREKNAVVK